MSAASRPPCAPDDDLPPNLRERLNRLRRSARRGLELLRTFHALGRRRTYRATAKDVDLSGATSVRRHIAALSKELGVNLILKTDKSGVLITQTGKAILAHINPLFGE